MMESMVSNSEKATRSSPTQLAKTPMPTANKMPNRALSMTVKRKPRKLNLRNQNHPSQTRSGKLSCSESQKRKRMCLPENVKEKERTDPLSQDLTTSETPNKLLLPNILIHHLKWSCLFAVLGPRMGAGVRKIGKGSKTQERLRRRCMVAERRMVENETKPGNEGKKHNATQNSPRI